MFDHDTELAELRARFATDAEQAMVEIAAAWVKDDLSNENHEMARAALEGAPPATIAEVVKRLQGAKARIVPLKHGKQRLPKKKLNAKLESFLEVALRPVALEVARVKSRTYESDDWESAPVDQFAPPKRVHPMVIVAEDLAESRLLDAHLAVPFVKSEAVRHMAQLEAHIRHLGMTKEREKQLKRAKRLIVDLIEETQQDPTRSAEMTRAILCGVARAFALLDPKLPKQRTPLYFVTCRVMELGGLVQERTSGLKGDFVEKRTQRVRRAIERFEKDNGPWSLEECLAGASKEP